MYGVIAIIVILAFSSPNDMVRLMCGVSMGIICIGLIILGVVGVLG